MDHRLCNFDITLEVNGVDPKGFRVERFRKSSTVNDSGVGCRITGHDIELSVSRHETYTANHESAMWMLLSALDEGRPTPIESLIKKYEDEECDFTDVPNVGKNVLSFIDNIPDSHTRCQLYVLARAAVGDPYKGATKIVQVREPLPIIREVGELINKHHEHLKQIVERKTGLTVKFSTTVRRAKLKSGTTDKLYGKIEATGPNTSNQSIDVYRVLGRAIAKMAGLQTAAFIYNTSATHWPNAFSASFRIVLPGEPDYDMWAGHSNVTLHGDDD